MTLRAGGVYYCGLFHEEKNKRLSVSDSVGFLKCQIIKPGVTVKCAEVCNVKGYCTHFVFEVQRVIRLVVLRKTLTQGGL